MVKNPILLNPVHLSDEELKRHLRLYREEDSRESLEMLLRAHSPLIYRVMRSMRLPSWIEVDDIYCDILPNIMKSYKTFDPTKSSIETYLFMVTTRAAMRAFPRYSPSEQIPESQAAQKPKRDLSHVLMQAGYAVSLIPEFESNWAGRLIAKRLLSGVSLNDIASQLGWTRRATAIAARKVKCQIAQQLVSADISLEPVISDDKLRFMASQAEKQEKTWFDE